VDWFLDLVGHLPDATVLMGGAIIIGVAALAIAALARFTGAFAGQADLETHSKLADLVHGSLLAFTVFTLALVLADVRSNLGKTLDQTLREASIITRLDAELQVAGGPEAMKARADLLKYVDAVAAFDWPGLAQPIPQLSFQADAALKALRASARAAARANPESASGINGFVPQIEDFRLGRLESATKSVTNVFWWIILAFLVGAMAMNGRHRLDRTSASLIFLHMAAIGLVLALILVMDQPFRGETSVSSAPIARALASAGASGL
jgi:hypothetical protein